MEIQKIYTRKGDLGSTSLFTGERVSKTSVRIRAYGTIDELNSALGVARVFCTHPDTSKLLLKIQNKVMNTISLLAAKEQTATTPTISEADITGVEKCIDYFKRRHCCFRV